MFETRCKPPPYTEAVPSQHLALGPQFPHVTPATDPQGMHDPGGALLIPLSPQSLGLQAAIVKDAGLPQKKQTGSLQSTPTAWPGFALLQDCCRTLSVPEADLG